MSCERELTSANVTTKVTTYAVITLAGNNPVILEPGIPYVEPGASTNTGDEITITGTVDENTIGQYEITYSAINEDGFPSSNSRDVCVNYTGDLVTGIEGVYLCDVSRVDPAETHSGLGYVFIIDNGDGTYELTHALGGFYSLGRGYGYDYEGQGAIITANDIPGNDFTVSDGFVPAWGDNCSVIDFRVDPETGTITYTTLYVIYEFHITLTQIQP